MISGLILVHLSRGRKACALLSLLPRLKEEGWAWQDRKARSTDWVEGSYWWRCYRAVDWPTVALVLSPLNLKVWKGESMNPSLSWWGLWGVCVTGASFPHLR